MSKLYVVRHAEPELTGVLLGASDPLLSEAGKCKAAAIHLPGVQAVYTSGLRRACDTAALIGSGPIIIDPDLNEISYGEWDGLTWGEITAKQPEQARAKLGCWPAVTPPGGEPWELFERRVHRAFARIRDGRLPAAVVAHVTVNAVITFLLTGRDVSAFTQAYGEVLTYDV
jgi:broad specificity phosphatase PhoE